MFLVLVAVGECANPVNAATVGQYLQYWRAGNFSDALLLLDNNASLTWHGQRKLFPFGGEWVGKQQISEFYSKFFTVFDEELYDLVDITLLSTEGGVILVQYEEKTVALSTQRPGFLENNVIFTVASGLITEIHVFLDTSSVYNQVHCPETPYLYCGKNSPPPFDPKYHRDMSPSPRIPPSPLNSNVTFNKHLAETYHSQFVAGNFDAALSHLHPNATVTWRGSIFNFPTIGGTWKGMAHIQGFYIALRSMFNISTFSSEILSIRGSGNIVLLRTRDQHISLITGRPSVEVNAMIFTFDDEGLIDDIDVWLDTAAVLEATMCADQTLMFSCIPYSRPISEVALAYLDLLSKGNFTGASSYLSGSASLSFNAPFTLKGGVYLPAAKVTNFYYEYAEIFDHEGFSNYEIVANKNPVVVVRYIENRTAVGSRLSYQLPTLLEFNINAKGTIVYMHKFLDSSTVLATKECLDRTEIQCDGNKPIGPPRMSDGRPPRLAPIEGAPNVTQNQLSATRFMHLLESGDFEESLDLLATDGCLTWQGSLMYFPTLGGTWRGKTRIRKFYANRVDAFRSPAFVFNTVFVTAASENAVVVAYYENVTSARTGLLSRGQGRAVFVFNGAGLIADVEFWVDTAEVLAATLCQSSSSLVVCSSPPESEAESPGQVWVTWIFGSLAAISIVVGACTYAQYRRNRHASVDYHEHFLTSADSVVN